MVQPRLTILSGGDCGSNDCPTVFATDRGTIAVQGFTLAHPTPGGESVVEIPGDILREAVRALGW